MYFFLTKLKETETYKCIPIIVYHKSSIIMPVSRSSFSNTNLIKKIFFPVGEDEAIKIIVGTKFSKYLLTCSTSAHFEYVNRLYFYPYSQMKGCYELIPAGYCLPKSEEHLYIIS